MNYKLTGGSPLLALTLVQIFSLTMSSENAQLTEGSDVFRIA
jgi:hypothetical protein